MKKICIFLLAAISAITLASCKKAKDYKIGIVQYVEHPSLNTIKDSIISKLNDLGYNDENSEILVKNAAGDTTLATQICQDFVEKEVNAVVAIATPTALAAVNACKNTNIPVIFSAVSDPVGAKLVDSLENPGNKCTGTSDELQVAEILNIAKEVDPNLKTIGFIYNESEDNSQTNIKQATAWAEANGVTVKKATGTTAAEIITGAIELADSCDAIFAPNDNTVAIDGTMRSLSEKFKEKNIPFYVGADSMVMQGGFATKGIEYSDLGYETAIMVDEIIKGKSVSEIPVKVFKDDLSIYVNKSYLTALNIELPDTIKNNPKLVLIGE